MLQALRHVDEVNTQAKAAYLAERSGAMTRLAIIFVQSVVIALLLYLAFVRFPQKDFLWTSDAQAVCKAVKLDHATTHHAELAQFAMEAAIGLNSYDFLNYRRSLTQTAERYLTPRGRDQFLKAIDDNNIIDLVKRNYYVVTSFVSDPPQIRDKGTKADVLFWNIEVPITIWYASGQARIPENRVLTMTIVTVDPSPQNPKGIAIDNITSSQRVIKSAGQ
jgi:intracellular multiplication protein IcmL